VRPSVRLRARSPLRGVAAILIALAPFALAAGCQPSRESLGSSVERQGARGSHRFRLRSVVKPARLTVGDPAAWTLVAELPGGARATSVLRDSAGPWMDVTALHEPGAGGAAVPTGPLRLEYRVRAFDLGRIPLPRTAVVVAWPDPRPAGASAADTLEFPPDTVTVDSLTTAESSPLEPDRGPIRPGLRPLDLALAAIGALVVLASIVAGILLWRSRRPRSGGIETASAPEPPEAPFRRAIDALRSEVDSLPRDVFYERLSLAVRAYLTPVTGLPALDLTTREIARDLSARGTWNADAVRRVTRTLDRSDLAKFARHEDPIAEAREALDEASSLVALFAPPPPAPAPPSTPAPPGAPPSGSP